MFFKIGVLRNFANFTGKHLLWSLFWINLLTFKSEIDVLSIVLLANFSKPINLFLICSCMEKIRFSLIPIIDFQRMILLFLRLSSLLCCDEFINGSEFARIFWLWNYEHIFMNEALLLLKFVSSMVLAWTEMNSFPVW